MTGALVVSAALMGLAGGPHCAVMCGAAQHGVAGRCGGPSLRHGLLALHAGRLFGYAAAGAALAGGVSMLAFAGSASPVFGAVWTMLQVGVVAFGLWLMVTARQPAWLSRTPAAGLSLADGVTVAPPRPHRQRTYTTAGLGALWVFLPCGLLQSALLVAALASRPLEGAVVMAAFAAASAVSLWLVPRLSLWILPRLGSAPWRNLTRERLSSIAIRTAGVLLAVSAAYALVHRLSEEIGAICWT